MLFGSSGFQGVQDANNIACIEVISDDSVHINLDLPLNSDLFIANTFAGPYNQLFFPTTSNGGLTVLIGNLINQSQILWYYFYDATNNSYSDTLANIVLDVDPMNGAGIANLSWNKPYTDAYNPPSGDFYRVWREYPSANWTEIAQVEMGQESYLDTIAICSAFLNYKVEWVRGNGCSYFSNIKGDFFNNNTPPDIPEIIQVSVDSSQGFASILWQIPPQQDIQGYVIVQNINGFSVAIDTIWDPSINYYIDYNSDVNNESYAYGIAAFDTCINPNSNPPFFYISPPTALDDFQHSILLQNEYLGCEQENILSWNSYINWPAGLLKYELYVSQDGAPYQLLSILSPGDTTYTHENLDSFSTYCYLVKAIDITQSRFSLSNILCQEIVYPGLPEIFYLGIASVDPSNNVSLEFFVDSSDEIDIQGFNIQALYPGNDTYFTIGFVPFDQINNYEYVDIDAPADIDFILYRIQILDGCGNDNFYSNEINTLFLNAFTDQTNALNTIVWTEAMGRAGTIEGYNLYQLHNGSTNLIYSAGPNEFYFQDDLSEEWEMDGGYCYYVECIEANNPYISSPISRSNQKCTVIEPRVWIPNSFIIGGDPVTFTPVFAYANVTDYKMTILNRWSQTLYETNDVFAGWDGYYEGNPVQQGVYIYIIQLEDGLGKVITQTGSVTVFSGN
jgi:hypothetical protein